LQRILLIERSATLRHAVGKRLCDHGYRVDQLAGYGEALACLADGGGGDYCGILVGWPSRTDPQADEFLAYLDDPEHRGRVVLILAHEAGATLREWVSDRGATALLLWDDYAEAVPTLDKLLTPRIPDEGAAAAEEHPVRILFVDDSPSVRGFFRRLLQRHGYRTDTAGSVGEGMEKALHTRFDIAIIDYYMPDATGDVLCRRLREDARTRHMMSAIITSTYLEQVIRDCLDAGAVECMFKNEANELFLARVAAMERAIRFQQSIEAERRRLEGILSSVGEGVYGVDEGGRITFINPAARRILGYPEDERLEGREPRALFHYADEGGAAIDPEDCLLTRAYAGQEEVRSWETVFWSRAAKPVPVECTVHPLTIDGRRRGSVTAFRDISERRNLEDRLRWQATHDPLTELINRRHFEEQLEQEVARLRRSTESSALLYIDLDRFKYINDTAGHAAGDQLLTAVARQLRMPLRATDVLARLGGDEFAVILRNVDPERIREAADKFRDLLGRHSFAHGDKSYRVSASIGVAVIDRNGPTPGDVLANADIACHVAKRSGRNQTHVFEGGQDEKAAMDEDLGWHNRLRDALQYDRFVLHYQPVVPLEWIDVGRLPEEAGMLWGELRRGAARGPMTFEALVRLRGPGGALIPPHAFLPTAERFGFMHEIDVWILTRALEDLVGLGDRAKDIDLSINLSAGILEDRFALPYIKGLLEDLQLHPGRLIFEITERSAIHNLEAARRFVVELRDLGCRFALDDFGSGFSSFSHLKHLPVDMVKIDGAFVRDIAQDPVDRAMVQSVNDIAHSLGRRTVAEYVESAAILRILREFGVDFVQGDYLAQPAASLAAAAGGAGNPPARGLQTSDGRHG